MKEKTLNEKREELFNKLLSKISVSFNDWQDFKKVIKEQDKQFIKEILDEIDKWKIRDYPKNSQKDIGWNNAILNVIDFIKQKAGFEELE